MRVIRLFVLGVMVVSSFADASSGQELLDARLLAESREELAREIREQGDARRGALLFYQPYLACQKCHLADSSGSQLGPDLTKWEQPATDLELIEAVLDPNRTIRKNFEAVTLVIDDGKIRTGILAAEDANSVTIRTLENAGQDEQIEKSEIEEIVRNKRSLMPKGLVNQLSNRQQFLDLVRYLMAIRDGGVKQARLLEPLPHLYATPPIPAYESDIDHAGLIRSWNQNSFQRGEAIYNRLCINCHGTKDKEGSLPTSLRFASGRFRSGSDPLTMYQTLTRGFAMMQPQSWMVPSQKYDVIHYIREAYLKPHNPSQYFEVTDEYLRGLPPGSTRGPAPQSLEPWAVMNYGDSLINTYEQGGDGTNFAYKGIAVRLDPGPGGVAAGNSWMIFDHDTLRMSAAWTGSGFIDWNGIHFDGRHNAHPHLVGDVQAFNPIGPGWAHPESGTWDDPRIRGRDDKPYGPLPRDWGHYKGLYTHGNRRVISYTLGTTDVLESPQLLASSPAAVFGRQFRIGPHPKSLLLEVTQLPDDFHPRVISSPELPDGFGLTVQFVPNRVQPTRKETESSLRFDGQAFAQVDEANDFDLTNRDFTISARIKTRSGGTIFSKTEDGPKWVPDGKALFVRGGRLVYDIGWVGAVTSKQQINDGKWHDVRLSWNQKSARVRLFIDGKLDAEGTLRPKAPQPKQVVRLGFAAPNFPGPKSYFEGEIESIKFFATELEPEDDTPQPVASWTFASLTDENIPDQIGTHSASIIRGSSPERQRENLLVGLLGQSQDAKMQIDEDRLLLELPATTDTREFTLWMSAHERVDQRESIFSAIAPNINTQVSLSSLTSGGPAMWGEIQTTQPLVGDDAGPFAVDVLTRPADNPWKAQIRPGGFDFFPDGDTAAVCAWDGDVWKVTGIESLDGPLRWQRIAAGLFQPLGVKIVDGDIYVTCRDQIVILRDLNGDGETDLYENFNNDHQVTEHFHEFAMGLQRDDQGNFYYAKSARHALKAVVPHHGTLLRISPDGSKTDIIATGFRAANGVCLNPDGTFIVTDQEGHWNPKNRINWVREGGFYGNMFGYHDVTDSSDAAMSQPLCWITNAFDRSPAELLWVPRDTWGPLGGSLLNLSYGYGKVYVVPHEEIDGQMQGGMIELPLPQFPTGLIRGRFHPETGQLYTCGMFAWAGNQQQPGGFYRIRQTGKPIYLPIGLHAKKTGVELSFTNPVDQQTALEPGNYGVRAWDLKRTANYGSKHFNEREWTVESVTVSDDGKTVFLKIPDIAPTWGMEIRYFLKTSDGKDFEGRIHNTIHHLSKE